MANQASKYPHLAYDGGSSNARTGRQEKGGGGGSGGGSTVDTHTKDYVDANIRAVKAENSANFARLEAKLDGLHPATWWQNAAVAGGAVVALLGILFTVLAIASDRFDSGVAAMGAIEEQLDAQRETNAKQDERLDRIISALEAQSTQPPVGPTDGQD